MTATTPRKDPGGQPQRIFINAGKVVDRPPTLFRMPAVKKPSALETAAAANAAAAPPATASLPADSAGFPPPATSPPATSPPATSPPATSNIPPQAAPPHPTTVPVASPAPAANAAPEEASEKKRNSYSAAAFLPAPAGKTWMESIGPRLVLLLLIAAVAAVAFLANRTGNSPVDTTFVGLEGEAREEDATAAKPAPGGAAPSSNAESPAKAPGASAATTPSATIPPSNTTLPSDAVPPSDTASEPVRRSRSTTELATTSRGTDARAEKNSTAKAAVPDFDLAELNGDNRQASNRPAGPSTAGRASNEARRASNEARRAGDDARQAGDDARQAASRTAAANDHQRVERHAESAGTDHAKSSAGSPVTETSPFVSHNISHEDAIFAAVDAAVSARSEGTSEAKSEYATTDQPAGVSNWLDFLPPSDTPSPVGDGDAFGAGEAVGARAPLGYLGGAMSSGSAPAGGLPYANHDDDQRGVTGANAPYAHTAANPYAAANATAGWDGGYAAPPASAAASPGTASPGTDLRDSDSAFANSQGDPQYGEPAGAPYGNAPYGNATYGSGSYANRPYGGLPQSSPSYEGARPGTPGGFDADFQGSR